MHVNAVDDFSRACGAKTPPRLLLDEAEGGRSETWLLHQPYALIGRANGSHLLLAHALVSRRHAYMQLLGGRYYAVDLGSRTGISPVDENVRTGWVDAELGMKVGPFRVRPERQAESTDILALRHPWTVRPMDPRSDLELVGLPPLTIECAAFGQTRSHALDRGLTLVGRGDECALRLDFPEVSKIHASLVLTPAGLWIVDLLGRGGVLVEGARVRHAFLPPGVECHVGPCSLIVRDDSAARGPTVGVLADSDPGETPAIVGELMPWSPPANIHTPATFDFTNGAGAPGGDLAPLFQQFGMMQQQMMDHFHQSMMLILNAFGSIHRESVGVLRDELAELRRVTAELSELQAKADAREKEVQARPAQEPAATARPRAKRPDPPAGPKPKPEDDQVHLLLQRRIAELQREKQTRWQRIMSVIQGAP